MDVDYVEKPELIRKQDINYLVGRPDKLIAETSWKPAHDFAQTIAEIIEYELKHSA